MTAINVSRPTCFDVPVYLNEMGLVCALGVGHDEVRAGLFAASPGGVRPVSGVLPGQTLHLGAVTAPLASLDELPVSLHSRNNALLLTALAPIRSAVDQAIARFGPTRVAVVLGTSTSGIGEAQTAIAGYHQNGSLTPAFHINQQELGSPAQALVQLLQLRGPALVVSTACSSSAKALASAARLLRAGMCDAVICGGVDALCGFTVAGFSALESVSAARCLPLSQHRNGINIGEGGALFLMSREPGPVRLCGWGESSDAYHISAPAPDGHGAIAAMQEALQRANLRPEQIDYINLHGTATPHNDAMESRAVHALFGSDVPVSSTKPLTGHTLGGAGALEAAIAWLLLQQPEPAQLPVHHWDGAADPELPALRLTRAGEIMSRRPAHILSNSFAFGGSNASLILGSV